MRSNAPRLMVLFLIASLLSILAGTSATASSCRPLLDSFKADITSLTEDSGTYLTVTLSCRTPKDVVVSLTSTGGITVGDLTVEAGHRTSRNYAWAQDLDVLRTGTVTARLGTRSRTLNFDIHEAWLGSIEQHRGGNGVEVWVSFTGPLEVNADVSFWTSSPLITMPASYSFTGRSQGGGPVRATAVQPVTEPTVVRIYASWDGHTVSTTKLLVPYFNSSNWIKIQPQHAYPLSSGQIDQSFAVLLERPAPPGGITVDVSAEGPCFLNSIPHTVSITEGSMGEAFRVDCLIAPRTQRLRLTASAVGVTAHFSEWVHPQIESIYVRTPLRPRTHFTIRVNLTAATKKPLRLELNSLSNAVRVPAEVWIPRGVSAIRIRGYVPATTQPSSDVVAFSLLGVPQYTPPLEIVP